MRVLVYEPNVGGHHLAYLRLLLPALRTITPEVIAVLGHNATQSPEYVVHLKSLAADIQIDASVALSTKSVLQHAMASADAFLNAIRRHKPDYIYVPYADGITQILGVRRSFGLDRALQDCQSEALMMRGKYAYPDNSSLRPMRQWAMVKAIAASPWDHIHLIDPIALTWLRDRGGQLAERISLLPDPVERPTVTDRVEARAALNLPVDGRYVGAFGVLDERKGTERLLSAFRDLRRRENDRLLLMGKLSPAIRTSLGSCRELIDSKQLIMFDRYVSDEDLLLGISACDLICTPYPRHIGSASIVIRAAAASRPVLASDSGWMGEMVPRFEFGETVDVTDHGRFLRALGESMERAPSHVLSSRGHRFVEFHSPENFRFGFVRKLLRATGKAEETRFRSWEWANGTG